jgi:hypothetical protein
MIGSHSFRSKNPLILEGFAEFVFILTSYYLLLGTIQLLRAKRRELDCVVIPHRAPWDREVA